MLWTFFLLVTAAVTGGVDIEGTVVDDSKAAAPNAQVFLEESLSATIRVVQADANGHFSFRDVDPGLVGLVAVADGLSFGGSSYTLKGGSAPIRTTVSLKQPGVLTGRIITPDRRPIQGAVITRVLLQEPSGSVSVPFAKLARHGVPLPVSGNDGRFSISQLPVETPLVLKVEHPLYAPGVLDGIQAGSEDVEIVLYEGVEVSGKVLARSSRVPLASAAVVFRNLSPPHDSVQTMSNMEGAFRVQLRPGIYAYRAQGTDMQSPGWEQLTVTGETGKRNLIIYMTGISSVHGEVRDASNREPVAGARIAISSAGSPSQIAHTNEFGEYELPAVEGPNTVRLESAPGYVLPENRAIRLQVSSGKRTELPVFWVKQQPRLTVRVLNGDGSPVTDAAVTLLRPRQFGWVAVDESGRAEVSLVNPPEDGPVVGIAEHRSAAKAGLFTAPAGTRDPIPVTLMDYGTLEGQLTDSSRQPLNGVAVGGVLADGAGEYPPYLWRTISDATGRFSWPFVVPGAPLSLDGRDTKQPIEVQPSEKRDLGDIVMDAELSGISLRGTGFPWDRLQPVEDGPSAEEVFKGKPALLVYADAVDIVWLGESLSQAKQLAGPKDLVCAIVVPTSEGLGGAVPEVAVFTGSKPGNAETYLIDRSGVVQLATFGLPPLAALQMLGEV